MKHFIYICFLFLIIVIFSYVNSLNNVENFTPKIRQFYRPIFRNVRITTENFYSKTNSNISNFFRKIGLM